MAGRSSYYRIDLKDYEEFLRAIPLSEFIEKNYAAIDEELKKNAPERYPFILYGGSVRRAQGAYLTRCTPNLYGLIRNAVLERTAQASDDADGTGVEQRVRAKIERTIPSEATRGAVLEFFALAIENADEERDSAWFLRETKHGLQLMTGRLLACEFGRSKMRVSVIGPVDEVSAVSSEQTRGGFGVHANSRWLDSDDAAGAYDASSHLTEGWAEQLH
jgi:hypothetical protein